MQRSLPGPGESYPEPRPAAISFMAQRQDPFDEIDPACFFYSAESEPDGSGEFVRGDVTDTEIGEEAAAVPLPLR